jgi:tetratricopeptide (TPR) repeat protein
VRASAAASAFRRVPVAWSFVMMALGAMGLAGAASSAGAQLCGWERLQAAMKAAKTKKTPRAEDILTALPDVPLGKAPSLREEYEAALRRFAREAREWRRDVAGAIRDRYRQKRATLEKTFEGRLQVVESEERHWRDRAIAKLEEFVERYPDDARHTPVRLAQLGELHFEQAQDDFNRAQEEFQKVMEEYRRTKQGKEPEFPMQRYDKTIAAYRKIVDQFRDFPDADGIYYILGYAYVQQNDDAEAVKAFAGLVERYPQSPFAAEAWTRLGELYFEMRPRRLKDAIAAYTKAISFEKSRFFDKALYKLAWAYYLDNQFAEGVKRFAHLVEWADAQKGQTGKEGSELRSEAVQYMGLSFLEEGWGGVQRASSWFENNPAAWAREVLTRVADLYFDNTKYLEAIQVYEVVLGRYPTSEENPRLMDCIIASYRLRQEVALAAKAAGRIPSIFGEGSPWYAANSAKKDALREVDLLEKRSIVTAAYYRYEQANSFQAAGNLGQAKAEYEQAAILYRRFLERFPTAEEAYTLRYAFAQALYFAFKFEEAAATYERVRDDKEEKKYQVDAALMAFKSIENWTAAERLLPPDFPKPAKDGKGIEGGNAVLPFPDYRRRLIDAGDKFLALAPKHADAPSVASVLAELHYRHKDLKEARKRFERILDEWPTHQGALNAARLLVDSYRIEQDWGNVERWSRRLIAMKIAEGSDRQTLVDELGKLQTGALFKRAEQLQKDGKYDEAAKEYVRLVDTNPNAEFADKALYNAGRNFEQIRKWDSAAKAFDKLLTRYKSSPLADKALFRIAQNSENFFEFDRAVQAYLRLYREFPQSDKRSWALFNAALSLENDQRYTDSARYFLQFANEFSTLEDAPTSFFRAGTIYLKAKRYADARRTFEQFIQRFGADARYRGYAVDAQAKIAESYATQGNRRAALREQKRIIEAYERSGFGPGSPAALAAARARFTEIETDFEEFRARKISGSAQRQGELVIELVRFMNRLEGDYKALSKYKILDWYLAALFRVGQLYQLLSQKMLDAPVPGEIQTQDEKDAYRTQLEDKAGVLERKATANYEIAYNEGQKNGIVNDWTKRALESLSVLNPVKYRVLKEPRSETQMETVSPQPVVRSVPGLDATKGGSWKPGGK